MLDNSMPTAFIIGGSGQIGLAIAARLAQQNWGVRIASRKPPPIRGPWEHVSLDRHDPVSFESALSDGANLLVDCIAFDADDARQIISVQDLIEHVVAISSASVYRDPQGRTLDEASGNGFPDFPAPIPEDYETVDPGPETYSTKKVALERALLRYCESKVTILRPCAVHGAYSRHAREWWFVRRLLDGRPKIPLAYGGGSLFQTTSTDAIADAVLHVADRGIVGVRNVADADAPTVAEIGTAIMTAMGREAELIGLPDERFPPTVGATPWSVERPVVCGSSIPARKTYAESVPSMVHWLQESVTSRNWRTALPQLAAYPSDLFDYDAEDEILARGVGVPA